MNKTARIVIGILFVSIFIVVMRPSRAILPPYTAPQDTFVTVNCTDEAMVCPDGTTVARSGPKCTFAPCSRETTSTPPTKIDPPKSPPKARACFVGGCSGQLCTDQPDMASTCEYREVYACYKSTNARCERQSTGGCGWTPTTTLNACLNADYFSFETR